MDRLRKMFAVVANGNGGDNGTTTSATRIQRHILNSGIQLDDFRLRTTMERLKHLGDSPISFETFTAVVGEELLMLNRTFNRELVIPDWQEFCRDIETVFDHVANDCSGTNANYIPILRDADPEKWGVALCSVDGQRLEIGDVDVYHSIQSVSKPITYAYAIEREGTEYVHQFVGVEPSGRPFNSLELLPDLRPFNPCVNAGAIMTAGVVASCWPE